MPTGGNFNGARCDCGPSCEQPTEPVATVGLCLADGTPIAVTVMRDCGGTVANEGWIDLTSGVWSAGAPPAGAMACGDARSIAVSGTFCDVDDSGDVLGLVLIEYSYGADGSIDGVRLVDAVTGETHEPQGTVTTCPAGVEQPARAALMLCDMTEDEDGDDETIPFVRDFARDETGSIVGWTDYTLEGDPYTPAGQVGQCHAVGGSRVGVETETLCVQDADGELAGQVLVERLYDAQTGQRVEQRYVDTLTGDEVELPEDATLGPCTDTSCTDVVAVLLCDVAPECADGPDPSATDDPDPGAYNSWDGPGVEPATWCLLDSPGEGAPVWDGDEAVLGPDDGCEESPHVAHRVIAGRLTAEGAGSEGEVEVTASVRVTNAGPDAGNGPCGRFALWDVAGNTVISHVDVQPGAPVGHVETLTVTGMVPAVSLTTGEVALVLDLETYHVTGKAWRVDDFAWEPGELPECVTQFRRALVVDCETGETVSQDDTTLDGEPYAVEGQVTRCTPVTGDAGACPQHLVEACRWDDTTGDGEGDTQYVAVVQVDGCTGDMTVLGTYEPDLSSPYVPVSPVQAPETAATVGAPAARGARAHRAVVGSGEEWELPGDVRVQMVTVAAHGDGVTVDTGDGAAPLSDGESASWAVAREGDAALVGPLTVYAGSGSAAVSWTSSTRL